jgi:hypothetical protein
MPGREEFSGTWCSIQVRASSTDSKYDAEYQQSLHDLLVVLFGWGTGGFTEENLANGIRALLNEDEP